MKSNISPFLVFVLFSIFTFPSNVSSISVMSVDLGSEWIKIAIVSPGVPMEIILNTDSQRKTPFAIAFRDGERFIGDSALSVGVRFPEKTFTHFLDLIGKRSLKAEAVQKYQKHFPYHKLIETENGGIAFVLKDNGVESQYTPEELLSMLLAKSRFYAEVASASSSPTGLKQTITDCVITVQPYLSQIERRSIKLAASLAGLKVLQLINTNAAFSLNYGVFRRKDFNSSNPTNILFYDMGAASTVATIASYQIVKTKERGFTESNPQLSIKGIGFDRNLGGFDLQLRLRDHIVKLFSEQSKKSIDQIRANNRAMAKMLKEAGRLMKVLSANTEHRAQIENVMNDIDLKAIVTREQFESLTADLVNERVTKLLDTLFQKTAFTMTEIDSFIIIGGATRIPKVQQLLQEYIQRDLGKNVNADEAGALGAAYQAAFLSKGFKVKTFHLKDANLYQINVDFTRDTETGETRSVSRVLFGRGNSYPQKKVITFNKHKEDFDFFINYGDLVPQDSEKNLFKVSLKDVASIYDKYSSNSTVDPKGIKVHFKMDESGILSLDNTEALFEVEYEEITEADNYEQLSDVVGDAISKFGSTISKLFGSNEASNETNADSANATADENGAENQTVSNDTAGNSSTVEQSKNDSASGNITGSSNSTVKVKKEIKKKIVKEEVPSVVAILDEAVLSAEIISASKAKLQELNQREVDKMKRDQSKNNLESFILETRDKLEQEEYSRAATDDEKTKLETELRAASEWLEYESDGSDASAFDDQLKKLFGLTKGLFERVREHRERPEAIASLKSMLNISDMFYQNAVNVSEEDQIFSQVELTSLRKLIDDTQTWLDDSEAELAKLKPSEMPKKLSLRYVSEKISALDREVKYLLNKARITPPKKNVKLDEEPKTDNTQETKPGEDEINLDGDNNNNGNEEEKQPSEEQSSSLPKMETDQLNDSETVSPDQVVDIPPKTEL